MDDYDKYQASVGSLDSDEYYKEFISSALDIQVGGNHYKKLKIQPGHFCQVNGLNHYESNVIKYMCRHQDKGGRQDIEKAIHYCQLLLEEVYNDSDI